jgi:phosphoglycerate dehydrogenase-like enzyme
MPTVLVNPPALVHGNGSFRSVLEQGGCRVIFPSKTPIPADELRSAVRQVDAVLASVEPYTRELMQDSTLRIVARMGVGFDAVDLAAATDLGIVVTTTPGTVEESVAESALALLLGVFRGYPGRDTEVRTGKWSRRSLPRLAGKTIGLVGLGRIGKHMVPRCQGLKLTVIACDPCADEKYARENDVRLCSLDELLATADIVSLHAPAMPSTRHLMNARTLAQMKRGSVLINTSRGALVDEAALVEALRSGHLMGAGLDVFEQEPLPTDSPLVRLDNVFLMPHIAGLDDQSKEDSSRLAAQCIVDVLSGRWPAECVVNPEVRSRLRK